jgi:hypothetical protein
VADGRFWSMLPATSAGVAFVLAVICVLVELSYRYDKKARASNEQV